MIFTVISLMLTACVGVPLNEKLSGMELFGGRKSHPAVVNPVLGQDPASVISLAGEWDFCQSDQWMRNTHFKGHKLHDKFLPGNAWTRKIMVPGVWEAQGVGASGDSECWDILADNNAKPIRNKFMGVGCYRKEIRLPDSWRNKRIWLKIGGVRAEGRFYVNDHPVAAVRDYCATRKFEVTDVVEAGKPACLVIQVSNLAPSRQGMMSAMHRWGGVYRDVELEATPCVLIDDAWVWGDFDNRLAVVHVGVDGLPAKSSDYELRVSIDGEQATIVPSPGENSLKLPLRRFRPWSPQEANLYTARVDLVSSGSVVMSRFERFGVRKLEVKGKELYLNGRPFYVRGFGDDHVYPLTGVTPPNRELHRRHLEMARRAGFNYVRLHTHCEIPEYFEAADEIGLIVQPELPYYNDAPTEGFEFDPVRDVTELWENYRRHPSFGVYSMGNEGTFGDDLDRALHTYVKSMDPTRLKINQDCYLEINNTPDRSDFYGGPITIWRRGSFDPDGPFVAHEYMNLCAKLDSRTEDRFVGAWLPPATRTSRANWLKKFGLGMEWGDRLQDAQHALQRIYQKKGIEAARTDGECDGYCYWTIADVVVANGESFSAQGILNPFWEEKAGGATVDEFSVFNGPSGVFLDVGDSEVAFNSGYDDCSDVQYKNDGELVFVSGERFSHDVLFSHYGQKTLDGVSLKWSLRSKAKELLSGDIPLDTLSVGRVRKIAAVDFIVPIVDKPAKAALGLSVGVVSNSWDVWIFPCRQQRDGRKIAVADCFRNLLGSRYSGLIPETSADRADLVIAEFGSRLANEALKRGQRVITLGGYAGKPNVTMGWWWMGKQVGTVLRKHRVFGELPNDGCFTPLLFRIVKEGRELPFPGLEEDDMFMVGEGGDACYLYIGQAKCLNGAMLMAFGLDLLSDTPEGNELLEGMIKYACSDEFRPCGRVVCDKALTRDED